MMGESGNALWVLHLTVLTAYSRLDIFIIINYCFYCAKNLKCVIYNKEIIILLSRTFSSEEYFWMYSSQVF